jgi:type IV fimbrial biogenesis protein FimT
MAASRPKTGGIGFARATGFTLVEMLMTMAIAAIVTAIAVPSFRYVTNSNRIASEINGLLGDLQLARAEAIKEGRNVTVCISDGSSCTHPNPAAWQNGWIVFSDPANTGVPAAGSVLRVQKTFSGTDTFLSSNTLTAVTFNREGYARAGAGGIAAGQLIILHDSTHTNVWTRCLSLTFVGQMTTEKVGEAANGTACP